LTKLDCDLHERAVHPWPEVRRPLARAPHCITRSRR